MAAIDARDRRQRTGVERPSSSGLSPAAHETPDVREVIRTKQVDKYPDTSLVALWQVTRFTVLIIGQGTDDRASLSVAMSCSYCTSSTCLGGLASLMIPT